MFCVRYLLYPPAQRLIRECATQMITDFGDKAEYKLRAETEVGTPISGRLVMWLIIRQVRALSRAG